MKTELSRLSLIVSLVGAAVVAATKSPESRGNSVTIKSLESKTIEGGDVYNRIAFFQDGDNDVWMMQQSHDGPAFKNPDRIAIVVDRSQAPARATYFQFEPGALEWPIKGKLKNLRVSCYLCHSNGPRVIRPAPGLSLSERAQLRWWNVRMKSYGRVLTEESPGQLPVRFNDEVANEPLKVPACLTCHNDGPGFARGALVKQNYLSIKFMVDAGLMPPIGRLSDRDRTEIRRFVAR